MNELSHWLEIETKMGKMTERERQSTGSTRSDSVTVMVSFCQFDTNLDTSKKRLSTKVSPSSD